MKIQICMYNICVRSIRHFCCCCLAMLVIQFIRRPFTITAHFFPVRSVFFLSPALSATPPPIPLHPCANIYSILLTFIFVPQLSLFAYVGRLLPSSTDLFNSVCRFKVFLHFATHARASPSTRLRRSHFKRPGHIILHCDKYAVHSSSFSSCQLNGRAHFIHNLFISEPVKCTVRFT